MPDPEPALTRFLNVDLDIEVKQGLSVLLAGLKGPIELKGPMYVLYETETFASLELNSDFENILDLDETIVGIVHVVQQLSKEARSVWDQCDHRTFNIGIQAGRTPHQTVFSISPETAALLVGVRGEIGITVYAPYDDRHNGEKGAKAESR